jgi:hypothetical protein
VRGAVAGGASASLAVAAHTAAGGAPPPGWLVVVTAALFVRLACGLAGRRRALPALVGWLGCSQLVAHVAFTLANHPAIGGSGHHHHVVTPVELVVELDGVSGTGAALMALAHLGAVAATGVLLHRADALLWAAVAVRTALPKAAARLVGPLAAVATRLRRRLAHTAASCRPVIASPTGRALTTAPPARPREHPLGRAARRRGPPALDAIRLPATV